MTIIGVIATTESEMASIKANLEVIGVNQIIGTEFFKGKMAGKTVVTTRSRIGKVNAALCAQILIEKFKVDCIINTGVAGAMADYLEIGDVIVSSELIHHDFDTTALGDSLGVNSSIGESFFKSNATLLETVQDICDNMFLPVKAYFGRTVSGDQFVADSQTKKRISDTFKPLSVDMESTAIAQTCYLYKIPFISIRSIADSVNEDAYEDFDKFLKQSSSNSCLLAEELIKSL